MVNKIGGVLVFISIILFIASFFNEFTALFRPVRKVKGSYSKAFKIDMIASLKIYGTIAVIFVLGMYLLYWGTE